MNLIITSPEQRCKHCLGTIWFRSNISKRLIKCPICKGTGLSLQSMYFQKKEINQNRNDTASLLSNNKWWEKFFYFSYIFKKKYNILSKFLPKLLSLKISWNWTLLVLFPTISSWILSEKNEDE